MRDSLLVCLGLSTSVIDVSADSSPPFILVQPPTTAVPTAWSGVGHPETNSCLDLEMAAFAKGLSCGPPLSKPCFDFERCSTEGIYIYDSDCSLLDSSTLLARDGTQKVDAHRMNHHYLERVLRDEAKDAGLLAATYESACIYIHIGEGGRGEACPVRSPLWNEGSQHLMVDMSDEGR